MLLYRLDAGPSGLTSRTFKCPKCGGIQKTEVSGDPMSSDMLGWFAGELRPPT
jgi:hypothetical protein